MLRSLHRALTAGLLLLALGACQTAPIKAPDTSAKEWRRDAAAFPRHNEAQQWSAQWQLDAKVGISIKQESEQANLIWEFHDQSHQVRLFGPLGSGTVKLEFDEFGAQLTDNKGRIYIGNAAEGRDAQQLLLEITGWPIPLNALAYWLFVLPDPAADFEYQVSDDGRVSAIKQLGWSIAFADYRDFSGVLMPRKITASKTFANPRLGKVRVRFIAKEWQWE